MPANFEVSQTETSWYGWPVKATYTMPADLPAATIDGPTHEGWTELLAAEDLTTAKTAAQKLELFENGRLHLTRFRTTCGHVVSVKHLCRQTNGVTALCTRPLFSKAGSCPHAMVAKWLEREHGVSFADMEQMSEKGGPTLAEEADKRLRKSKTPKMPSKAAYMTMKEIITKVRKRAELRKRKQEPWVCNQSTEILCLQCSLTTLGDSKEK